MSCYDWERGEFNLPAKEYTLLRKKIIKACNERMDRMLESLKVMWAKRKEYAKHGRFKKTKWIRKMLTPARGSLYWYERSVDDSFEEVYELQGLLDEAIKQKRAPSKTSLAKHYANTRTRTFTYLEATLRFLDNNRIEWIVDENNRAVEHARECWLGVAFFQALSRVQWTSRTGGRIWGDDEYSREADEQHGYPRELDKDHYGAQKKAYERERAQRLGLRRPRR